MTQPRTAHWDLLTIIAIALIVDSLADVIHEGLGHGGACLLVGGKPRLLTSMNFFGDHEDLPRWTSRVVSAGGTIANLFAAGVGLLALRSSGSNHCRYFWWLFAAVNLLVGTGYFLYSGVGNIGDWANFIDGFSHHTTWRVALFVIGAVSYYLSMLLLAVRLSRFLPADPADRLRTANLLSLTPYFTGAILGVSAGMFNPNARALILISAVAASLGGTCGLLWIPQFLRGDSFNPPLTAPPFSLPRNWAWIIAGFVTAATFIAILGPGIHFPPASHLK